MNASALLKSQGWRGKGHSLHPTDNSIGLSNPLLLSRNTDGKGLGANKTFTDQWWLAAFDEKLKGLDVSKKGVVQTVKDGALNALTNNGGGRYSGLYASFVKGGLMEGTLSEDGSRAESTDGTPASEDRESVAGLRKGVVKKESKSERRARKEAKLARKATRAAAQAARAAAKATKAAAKAEKKQRSGIKTTQPSKEQDTKEERRARRIERRARKEARRRRRDEKEAKKAAKG